MQLKDILHYLLSLYLPSALFAFTLFYVLLTAFTCLHFMFYDFRLKRICLLQTANKVKQNLDERKGTEQLSKLQRNVDLLLTAR